MSAFIVSRTHMHEHRETARENLRQAQIAAREEYECIRIRIRDKYSQARAVPWNEYLLIRVQAREEYDQARGVARRERDKALAAAMATYEKAEKENHKMTNRYIGFFCPICGKGLQEAYEGVSRLAECIKGHFWKVTVEEDRSCVLRSAEKSRGIPQKSPAKPAATNSHWCEYGEEEEQ